MKEKIPMQLILILVTIAVIYFFFSLFTPYVFDDLCFMSNYKIHNGGSESFSLSALCSFANEVRTNDNGRLSNILSPIATLMTPKWLFAAFTGIGVAGMFYLMSMFTKVASTLRAMMVLIIWVTSIVFLPWRNCIIVNDYLLNYLYPSLAILGLVWVMDKSEKGQLNSLVFLCGIFLSVMAAWFHEGFSVPICFGFAARAIYKKFRFSYQWWVLAVIFGLTTLWVVIAPGTLNRADNEMNRREIYDQFYFIFTCLPAFVIYYFLLIAFALRIKTRALLASFFNRSEIMIFSVAAIAATLIILMVDSDPRSSWPPELYSIICLFSLFILFKFRVSRRFLNIAFSTIYILSVIFFINVIRWQYLFNEQHKKVEILLSASPTGTVYYNLIDPRSMRKSTLFLPMRNEWITSFHLNLMNDTVSSPDRFLAVVPKELETFSADKAMKVKGTADLSLYNGILVGKDETYLNSYKGWWADEYPYDFVLEDGSQFNGVDCFRIRFRDPSGILRMYVLPHADFPSPVSEINLH